MKELCTVRSIDCSLKGNFIALSLSHSAGAQRANSVQAGIKNFASVCFLLGIDDRFGGVAGFGSNSKRESRSK